MDYEEKKGNVDIASAVTIEASDQTTSNAYNFPFTPYDIQLKLMKVAYDTYEDSKFALLESPTGTGKSLSLICSSLTWLRNHQHSVKQELEDKKAELTLKIEEFKKEEELSNDWLSIQTKRQDVNRELAEVNLKLDRIIKFEQRSEARRHAKLHDNPFENYSALNPNRQESDDSLKKNAENECNNANGILGSQESATNEEDENIEKKVKEQEEDHIRPKIYYASRTHSQLTQFINEVKRTKFADINLGPPIKVAPLASRANLCVNPDVLKLKDSNAINERCVEMQRESCADKRCSYMKSKYVTALKEDILSNVQDIEDIVKRGRAIGGCPYYATRMSIPEADVVVLPYNNLLHHETRKASSLDLKESVVIVDEAHNILETICSIHSAPITGQQLIGSHTILSRYYTKFHSRMSPRNAEIIKTIVHCLTALLKYLNEPKRHLEEFECPKSTSIENNTPVKPPSDSKKQVENARRSSKTQAKHEEFMIDVLKFISAANIERFNVFKILDYFNRSQLARKLIGFFRQDNTFDLSLDLYGIIREKGERFLKVKGHNANVKSPAPKKRKISDKQPVIDEKELAERRLEQTNLNFLTSSNPNLSKRDSSLTSYPIYTLVEFLKSLTNLAHDGKVLTDHFEENIQQSVLKFVLLNPSGQFKQMTQEARSIVLAGGTMQPFEEFRELLFGPLGIDDSRLSLFSCGHVIPPEQLFAAAVSNGPLNKPLELSYKTRTSLDTIDEIGRAVQSISSTVPGGMVCFLPSYDYEQLCFSRWTQIGVISYIETKCKQVFREPKLANQVKTILDDYSRTIEKGSSSGRGAMLMCVVGGKMSEGINFNDDLGRCIVMIGLPYANIKSGELQQKMSYYDRTCKRSSASTELVQSAGQQYYENLCIKGINQSIGRAIRHKNDYAAIIMLDRRYSTKVSIKEGLPKWISKSLVNCETFDPLLYKLKAFFKSMDVKQENI